MTVKKTKPEVKKLTAHGLLGSLSYWGTSTRMFLVGVLLVFAYMLNLSGSNTAEYLDGEAFFLIYGGMTLLILDLGYVVAARALPLHNVADRWVVMMSDLLLAGFFVTPSLFIWNIDGNKLRIISLILVLLLVSVRVLVGLLFAKRK